MAENEDQEQLEEEVRYELKEQIEKITSSDKIIYDVAKKIRFLDNEAIGIGSPKRPDIFEHGGNFEQFLKAAEVANTKIIYYQGYGSINGDETFVQLKGSEDANSSWGAIFFFKNSVGDIHLFVSTNYSPPYQYFADEQLENQERELKKDNFEMDKKLDEWAFAVLNDTLYKNAKNEKQRKAAISEFVRIKKIEENLKYINEWKLSEKIELIKMKKETSNPQQNLVDKQ